jgi:hypothetical protein
VFILLTNSAFTYSVSQILTQPVRDKETKSRETLAILGMRRSAYMLSYFIVQAMSTTLTSLVLVAAIKIGAKSETSSFSP